MESLVSLLTLVFLCTAALMIFVQHGPRRTGWIGCAIFGWAAFAIGFWPLPNPPSGPPRLVGFLQETIPYINPELARVIKKYSPPPGATTYSYADFEGQAYGFTRFRRIAYLLIAFSMGSIGGVIGRGLAEREMDRAGGDRAS